MAVAPPFYAYLEELRALQGEAKVTYPTGDRNYPVTERVRTLFNTDIAALLPGTPEPNAVLYPRNFLVTLEVTKADEQQSEVYLKYESSPGYPSGQNAWSYELNYVSQGLNYPIYIRRTTERRTEYQSLLVDAPPAKIFSGVTEIRVTNPGKDYKTAPGVDIALGSATAIATAVAHIVAGKVVRIELTSHGWGYTAPPPAPTSPPMVTIAGGGGTGATAVAFLQSSKAVLVSEETQPAPGDLAADFIVVTRTWKTLNGPVLTGEKLDPRTGLVLTVIRQEVLAGTTLGALPAGTVSAEIDPVSVVESLLTSTGYKTNIVTGDNFPFRLIDADWDDTIQGDIWEMEVEIPIGTAGPEVGDLFITPKVPATDPVTYDERYVVDRKIRRLNDGTMLYTLTTVEQPADWEEFSDAGEQFPALFDFLIEGAFSVPSLSDFNRPGVVYNYLAHRTDSYTQRILHIFINLKDKEKPPDLAFLGEQHHVLSPAAGSRVFPINANTIHPAFQINDSKGPLEIFPASVPSYYNPNEQLYRGASCAIWRGRMYHIIARYSCENGFVGDLGGGGDPGGGIQVKNDVWLAKSDDGGIVNLTDKTHLVYDGEPGDRFVVSGTVGGHPQVEDITIAHYGPMHGPANFSNLQTIYFDSPAVPPRYPWEPRVMTAGKKAEYKFAFWDTPSPGDTWSTKVNLPQYAGEDFTYTFCDDLGAIKVAGGATAGGAPLDGTYFIQPAAVNLKSHYLSSGGGEMFYDGDNWILQLATALPPVLGANYFMGNNIPTDYPEVLTWSGVGATSATDVPPVLPIVTRVGKFSNSPREVMTHGPGSLPSTLDYARKALVAAINLDPFVHHVPTPPLAPYDTGAGIQYGEGTEPNPYFQEEASAVDDAVDDTIKLIGRVASKRASELDYTGTANGALAPTKDAASGGVVADEPAGSGESTHYNHSKLTNPWYSKLNVPPGLVDAPSEEFVFTTERRVTIRWRMQPEVTIKYQTWNPGSPDAEPPVPADWNTAQILEPVDGNNVAELPPVVTTRMRFLISNSDPVQARACDLYVLITES